MLNRCQCWTNVIETIDTFDVTPVQRCHWPNLLEWHAWAVCASMFRGNWRRGHQRKHCTRSEKTKKKLSYMTKKGHPFIGVLRFLFGSFSFSLSPSLLLSSLSTTRTQAKLFLAWEKKVFTLWPRPAGITLCSHWLNPLLPLYGLHIFPVLQDFV